MSDYNSYERSTAVAPFDTYSLNDGMIAWIDLLGVRSATHQQIVTAVKKAKAWREYVQKSGSYLAESEEGAYEYGFEQGWEECKRHLALTLTPDSETPNTLKVKADPTLKPDEWRLEFEPDSESPKTLKQWGKLGVQVIEQDKRIKELESLQKEVPCGKCGHLNKLVAIAPLTDMDAKDHRIHELIERIKELESQHQILEEVINHYFETDILRKLFDELRRNATNLRGHE